MASTAERLRKLVIDNIEIDGKPLDIPEDLNISLSDAGVSSTDVVAFARLVSSDFNITFTPEDCGSLDNLQKVVEFVESKSA